MLAEAVAPLALELGVDPKELDATIELAASSFGDAMDDCWRRKLGFASSASGAEAAALYARLDPLLRAATHRWGERKNGERE